MGGGEKKQGNIQGDKETEARPIGSLREAEAGMSLLQMSLLSFTTGFSGKEKRWRGWGWVGEVPWLTVGLAVGQSMRTRVLVISRLVLLTPGLLVPELQKHLDVFNDS